MIGAIAIGVVFAIGLAISGMTHPTKVAGFLDVTGHWDPTLMFVMGGAILAHLPLLRWAKRRGRPILEPAFHNPKAGLIDLQLIVGSALFGVGWGLSGYCPGPALVSAGRGSLQTLAFLGAMIAGMAATRFVLKRVAGRSPR